MFSVGYADMHSLSLSLHPFIDIQLNSKYIYNWVCIYIYCIIYIYIYLCICIYVILNMYIDLYTYLFFVAYKQNYISIHVSMYAHKHTRTIYAEYIYIYIYAYHMLNVCIHLCTAVKAHSNPDHPPPGRMWWKRCASYPGLCFFSPEILSHHWNHTILKMDVLSNVVIHWCDIIIPIHWNPDSSNLDMSIMSLRHGKCPWSLTCTKITERRGSMLGPWLKLLYNGMAGLLNTA